MDYIRRKYKGIVGVMLMTLKANIRKSKERYQAAKDDSPKSYLKEADDEKKKEVVRKFFILSYQLEMMLECESKLLYIINNVDYFCKDEVNIQEMMLAILTLYWCSIYRDLNSLDFREFRLHVENRFKVRNLIKSMNKNKSSLEVLQKSNKISLWQAPDWKVKMQEKIQSFEGIFQQHMEHPDDEDDCGGGGGGDENDLDGINQNVPLTEVEKDLELQKRYEQFLINMESRD